MTAIDRLHSWFDAHDPGGVARAKGVKAAVVVTVGLATGILLDQPDIATFAAFGGIALLLLTDLPGNRSARLGSYLLLAAVGAVLITVGTLASTTGWLAVVSMLVVGFGVLFSGVVSAAINGAGRAALLTYILPVCLTAPPSAIGGRLTGWALAAALAIPAAVFWWPPRQHEALRTAAADACRDLGRRILRTAGGGGGPAPSAPPFATPGTERDELDPSAAIRRLRETFGRSESRPVGLTTGSRLLGLLVDRLAWLNTVVTSLPAEGGPGRRPEWARRLERRCGQVLLACEDTLVAAGTTRGPDAVAALDAAIESLEQDRVAAAASRQLLAIAARTTERSPALLHELAHTCLLAGATVAAAGRADARPTWDRILGRNNPPATLTRWEAAGHLARGHLSVRSVWFQNSLRGAIGLALAVLLAEVTHVSHGFWVVLGALTVLRTTAVNTGSTAVRALGGTVLGFLLGAAVLVMIGSHPMGLWILLPVTIALAGCLPTMVSFVAGQTAFTVLVMVLFNIVVPVGWSIGLVRIEDVVIGAAAAAVCALLWPHGAAGEVRRSLADAYRTAASALSVAVQTMGAPPDLARTVRNGSIAPVPWTPEQTLAAEAAARLDDAVRQYLGDHGARRLPVEQVTLAANAANRLRLTAGAILSGADHPGVRPLPDVVRPLWATLRDIADSQRQWFEDRAADIAAGPHARRTAAGDALPPVADALPALAERTVLSAVRRHPALLDDETLWRPMCGLWWTALFLDDASRLQDRLGGNRPGPVSSDGSVRRPAPQR